MKLHIESMLGLDIDGAIKSAVDRWISEHVSTFEIGGNEFRIISLETVPEDEFWVLDNRKANLLKFKLTAARRAPAEGGA